MANSKFITTELQLRRLKPSSKAFDVKVANVPGLVVRVSKTGTKSFRWDRGSKHKPRIITHGTYPTLSLKDARTAHEKARQQHAAGTLTLARMRREKLQEQNKQEQSTPRTIADLAERYFNRVKKTLKRPELVRRTLDADIIPVLGEVKLESITPLLVSDTIELVVSRGATVYAHRVHSILKQLLDMGVQLGLMDSNPAAALSAKFLGIENNERTRRLSSEEIRLLWQLLDADEKSITAAPALKLLLLLGIRSGELRLAQWQHVDLDKGVLTVPVALQKLKKDKAKTARDFLVPLDNYAISLFRQLEGLHDVYVLPNMSGSKPMDLNALPRAVRRITEGKIEPFVPHDLRRTCRSGLSKIGIKPHIAERCLNHSLGKIQNVYDRHDYLSERREALEAWSEHVRVVVGAAGDNVVSMGVVK